MDDGKKRSPTVLAALILAAAFFLWLLGVGPLCWVSSRWGGRAVISEIYRPMTWTVEASGSRGLMDAINRYSELRADRAYTWSFNPHKPGSAKWQSVFDVEEYMAAEPKVFFVDPTTGSP